MQENEPVLLVLSVCDREIILEKGEILSEKHHEMKALDGQGRLACESDGSDREF
jgi:hypothetical protein